LLMDTARANKETATADARRAAADVERARAQLAIQETDLSKASIKSPIDGVVLKRSIEPGQTVAASYRSPDLFVLAADLRKMKLVANVAEADVNRVAVGNTATFTVDAWPDRRYRAVVRKIEGNGENNNGVVTYGAELEVSNDDLTLRDGMTAVADIQVAPSKGVLFAPTEAFHYIPRNARGTLSAPPAGEARIWLLRDNRPVPVLVRHGEIGGSITEVAGDNIAEGDAVIISETK